MHAYYISRGEQPGLDYGDYSTTLAELLCVGLGPWTENAISENQIRAAWPPQDIIPDNDHLNNRQVAQRTIYHQPIGEFPTATQCRLGFHCI